MNRLIYIPLSAALALPIADEAHEWMSKFASTTVDGRALAPYQYRLLFAYIFDPMVELLSGRIAAWLFWFICLAVLMLLMDKIVGKEGQTISLAAFAILPVAISFHPGGAMWSVLEALFIAGALLALMRGKTAVLYPLVFLATLNRETAVLIPLMYFFIRKDPDNALGLMAVWGGVAAFLRLFLIGEVPTHVDIAYIWAVNTGPGLLVFFVGLPMFGWLFVYAARGWRRADGVLRGAAAIIPAYMVLFGIFGIWYEWRWILALYPVLIPLAAIKSSAVVYDGTEKGVGVMDKKDTVAGDTPFANIHGRSEIAKRKLKDVADNLLSNELLSVAVAVVSPDFGFQPAVRLTIRYANHYVRVQYDLEKIEAYEPEHIEHDIRHAVIGLAERVFLK